MLRTLGACVPVTLAQFGANFGANLSHLEGGKVLVAYWWFITLSHHIKASTCSNWVQVDATCMTKTCIFTHQIIANMIGIQQIEFPVVRCGLPSKPLFQGLDLLRHHFVHKRNYSKFERIQQTFLDTKLPQQNFKQYHPSWCQLQRVAQNSQQHFVTSTNAAVQLGNTKFEPCMAEICV